MRSTTSNRGAVTRSSRCVGTGFGKDVSRNLRGERGKGDSLLGIETSEETAGSRDGSFSSIIVFYFDILTCSDSNSFTSIQDSIGDGCERVTSTFGGTTIECFFSCGGMIFRCVTDPS